MSLPTKDEISQAIERKGTLKVPQLNGFSPIAGILGPESYAGGFCIVFPFQKGNEKKAVRVWHQEIGDIKQRYNLISADIHKYGAPYLCDVDFIEDGLDVDGTLIDVVTMDWIEGLPLKKYIQAILDSNDDDSKKKLLLKELAEKLLEMFDYFHHQEFSHGDLQHDNIIITSKGDVKVIDYDCFYTPALGSKFLQTTSGYKGYQHPSRFTGQIISNEKADYFSELIIYLSILSLSEDFSLWEIAEDSDFSFLFSEQDFEDITNSVIYKRLCQFGNECVELLDILVDYLEIDNINELYPFTDALLTNKVLFSASAEKVVRNRQVVTLDWFVPFGAKVTLANRKSNFSQNCELKGRYATVLQSDADFVLIIDSDNGQHIEKVIGIKVFDECTIDFYADKYYIFPTIPVSLSWHVKNAKKIWFDSDEVEALGKKVIEPEKATTYVLTAEDEFGIKEKRIDIQMLPIPLVKTLLVPTPKIENNLSVTIHQPKIYVDVKIPEINIDWIKTEVPKVPSFKELGLNVELSPPLPKFSLISSIKKVFNHVIRK